MQIVSGLKPEDSMDQRIQSFADLIASAAKENLVSLVLYGSGVRDGLKARNLNLLVVLTRAGVEDLAVFRKMLAGPGRALKVQAVFLTERDLARSSDVFPIEHLEMASSYEILKGRDVLKRLRITKQNLRHEVEYQARSVLLRLRASAAELPVRLLADSVLFDAASSASLLFRYAGSFTRKNVSVPPVFAELSGMKRAKKRIAGADKAVKFRELLEAVESLVRLADGK
jgi:hypothetical protein